MNIFIRSVRVICHLVSNKTCYIADDAMFYLLFIIIALIHRWTSACQLNAIIWRYYPCSILLTSPNDNACSNLIGRFWIDRCENEEVLVFWHDPMGNLTLTFGSEKKRPFAIRLFTTLLSKNPSIKSVYHLIHEKNAERRLFYKNPKGMVHLRSDHSNQCTMKFESANSITTDYGMFIRMMIVTNSRNRSVT